MASGGGESHNSYGHRKLSIRGEGIVWKFLSKMIKRKKKKRKMPKVMQVLLYETYKMILAIS